jgi:thiol-disulfide isomerase/thioredoxin
MIEIPFIYSKSCKDCKKMESLLEKAIEELNADIVLNKIDCEDDLALDLAVDNDIDDIPACIIGDIVLFGKKNVVYKTILDAMKLLVDLS